MASFYGWTPGVIENLEYVTALEYYMAIDCIESQQFLADLQASDYSRASKEHRKELFRKIRRKAYPEDLQKTLSFEEFARKMNGGRKNNS